MVVCHTHSHTARCLDLRRERRGMCEVLYLGCGGNEGRLTVFAALRACLEGRMSSYLAPLLLPRDLPLIGEEGESKA